MPTVSVFGSNSHIDEHTLTLAEDLGQLIVDLGCRVCTGGLSGIMEAVSKGARSSEKWTGNEVIGIIPQDDPTQANEFVDVVVPTGLGLYRNIMVARAGDACIAVSGGSGTLSEIAFAWQFRKPVAVMTGTGGWSDKLAGEELRIGNLGNSRPFRDWLTRFIPASKTV